jgi:hypothetical protein
MVADHSAGASISRFSIASPDSGRRREENRLLIALVFQSQNKRKRRAAVNRLDRTCWVSVRGVPRRTTAVSMSYISHSDHARRYVPLLECAGSWRSAHSCLEDRNSFLRGRTAGPECGDLWRQCMCHGAESAETKTVLTGMLWLSTRYPCAVERCEFQAWKSTSERAEEARVRAELGLTSISQPTKKLERLHFADVVG